jgi:hypothetical protein
MAPMRSARIPTQPMSKMTGEAKGGDQASKGSAGRDLVLVALGAAGAIAAVTIKSLLKRLNRRKRVVCAFQPHRTAGHCAAA